VPAKPVVIHLDDGYLDNWVAAAPLLARYRIPATIMVSLDFVEPGMELRPTIADVESGRIPAEALVWSGYMNWSEIAALEASQAIEIEAHGVDHARVVTGPKVIDQLQPHNWRSLAWMQWAATPGNKSGWYLHSDPPFVPFGTDVRENAPALASREWSAEGTETADAYAGRVRDDLAHSRETLAVRIGRPPLIFCWPENALTRQAHEIALGLGYRATTGGHGENRPEEDPTVISRVHAGDRALGWRWGFLDDLRLLAACRAFQGNYYWCFPLFAIHGLGRAIAFCRNLIGRRAT
jgi:peptidoglycan/xylan/chitin deacetylase (PgdA/CDA1 family)